MSKVTVCKVTGEMEVFKNVEVKTTCKFTSLKALEDKVIRTREGVKGYIDILKHACRICKYEYVDSIGEILDQVYLITVNFKINSKIFSNFFIGLGIEEDNNWSNIVDSIQSFIGQDEIIIFDGKVSSIDWLKDEVNKLML